MSFDRASNAAGASVTTAGAVEPVHVPDAELDDLRSRLRRTRWPMSWPGQHPGAGVDPRELARLVTYWLEGYDWRRHESAINALPRQVAQVNGQPVHYLHFEAEHPGALPLLLTHGWPSSFLELVGLAERLSYPTRYGGEVSDAFTVIVPSLPGFGFAPQQQALPGQLPTHELWHRLMRDELGFPRYAAHGGDLGAGVTSRLAQAHPEAVVGIHILAVAPPSPAHAADPTHQEQAYLATVADWQAGEGGYQHEQSTKPLTLAYGLSDSPVGLLAWLLEKYTAWSDPRGGHPAVLDDDVVLTQVSLYWFTNSISTSFRPYFEFAQGALPPLDRIAVPTAVALFPADLTQPPRSWAERTYELARYTVMPRGGHFPAVEEPALLADDITAFFRTVR